jgi:predicted HTH domain antitoxin
MTSITLEIPETVLESHQQNLTHITNEAKQGFIIWEYLNGHLSIKQSADMLKLSYRNFIDLLLSRGVSIDALSNDELNKQCADLDALLK